MLTDGGKIDVLNVFSFCLVALSNIINQVHTGKLITDRLIYSSPFFLFVLLILVFKNNKYLNSFIYLIIAVGTTIDPQNISDYSGSIFFIFSFHLIKSSYYGFFILAISVLSITIRSVIFNDTVSGNVVLIVVFIYIYTVYYLLIFKKSTKKSKILTKEQNQIMNMIGSEGLSQKEIAYKLGISNDVLYNKIYDIRKIYSSEGVIIPLNQLIYEFASTGNQ